MSDSSTPTITDESVEQKASLGAVIQRLLAIDAVALLMALLDFTEAFGANTRRMIPLFEEMEDILAQAGQYYLELRFQQVLQEYSEVDRIMSKAEEEVR